MELRYVLITLLKILISTPNVLLLYRINTVYSSALMGGHLDNRNNSFINITDPYYEYDITDGQELDGENNKEGQTSSEEIPDPSALVLPGYNLPENLFNHGKPFYVEKNPMTGDIDFSHKSPSLKLESDLDQYVSEEDNDNIYDKSNIDRKDGNISGHKHNDVNQLTPNFHDFLNLPVKYNPDKFMYPLISTSYASTKVQGSVNKFHNHKDYITKTTTKRPTGNPTYYTANKYFNPKKTISTTFVTTTHPTTPIVTNTYPSLLTTKSNILMNSEMSLPSSNDEFDYNIPPFTANPLEPTIIQTTTESSSNVHNFINSHSTTQRPLSLFEQLFGEYDETIPSTVKTMTSSIGKDLLNKDDDIKKRMTTEKSATTVLKNNYSQYQNAHAGPNILTGSNMGLDSNYDYEDYESENEKYEDNVAVENKPIKNVDDDLRIEPLNVKEIQKEHDITVPNNSNSTIKNDLNKDITTTKSMVTFDYDDYQEQEEFTSTSPSISTYSTTINSAIKVTPPTTTDIIRVTSLPLGENHLILTNREPIHRDPIIVATQNLREKLSSEKVLSKPYKSTVLKLAQHTQPPSTSNIHIAPDQDTVSFVVGNHQNVGSDQYVETSVHESPYDSNPFRPLYGHTNSGPSNHFIQRGPQVVQPQVSLGHTYPDVVGSAVTIQPLQISEASLAIGMPVGGGKQIPGQVVDEKLELTNTAINFSNNSNNIVFPNEKQSEFADLIPPPTPAQPKPIPAPFPNRDVLSLDTKPVYHQLSSALTPPKEKEGFSPLRRDNKPLRPPWDSRPGLFLTRKPEYRPPRPPPEISYKRIDNLPNILPQFRPNMNIHVTPTNYLGNKLIRQPLLERPSNRPIVFFEKLQPPPPPPFPVHKNIQNLRKVFPSNAPPRQSLDDTKTAQDRIIHKELRKPILHQTEKFGFYQTPPPMRITNRRNSDDITEIETLQMIQAKNTDKNDRTAPENALKEPQVISIPAGSNSNDHSEKTVYKVYPVNTSPIKLDAINDIKKESVVIGTRAELPLPPSKINKDFTYEPNPLFDIKDRNDDPILKPHHKPQTFPVKSDFPYPLERLDLGILDPAVRDISSNTGNSLNDSLNDKFVDDLTYLSNNNQWNTIGENIESRILNSQKMNAQSTNQISATLKTFTEKPIAVAYTPTEPSLNADKYSMPNYGGSIIPEIRLGTVENADTGHSRQDFTLSAVMHTHQHSNIDKADNLKEEINKRMDKFTQNPNHKNNIDTPDYTKLDFEAPFQASINIDQSVHQGWSIVRNKNKTTTYEATDVTTMSYATTSEFDIENFKPQLEGGFKPIYNFPNDEKKLKVTPIEREE